MKLTDENGDVWELTKKTHEEAAEVNPKLELLAHQIAVYVDGELIAYINGDTVNPLANVRLAEGTKNTGVVPPLGCCRTAPVYEVSWELMYEDAKYWRLRVSKL